jgi:hypothetical protein
MVLEGDEAYDCWQTVFEFEADKVRQLRADAKWRALISSLVTSTSFVRWQAPCGAIDFQFFRSCKVDLYAGEGRETSIQTQVVEVLPRNSMLAKCYLSEVA